MNDAEKAVVRAAVEWWEDCRPTKFDLAQHLDNPAVNTSAPSERRLAEAVAAHVKREARE